MIFGLLALTLAAAPVLASKDFDLRPRFNAGILICSWLFRRLPDRS